MSILGAVLAGGQARRFGSDKGVASWRGRSLIEHSLAAIRPCADALVVCGRDWPGLVALSDRPRPGLGPLGGLNAALTYAASHGFDRVLCVPCDTPVLSPDLLRGLINCDGAALVAEAPVVGVWPTALHDILESHLEAGGDRSMRGWAAAVGAERITAGPVANINYRADLDALDD